MTPSLDRAVEAGLLAMLEFRKSGGDWTEHPHHACEVVVRAALPHLGVDREALRRLAEKWRFAGEYEYADPNSEVVNARGRVRMTCAGELIHLIETNQEAGHAR
jgi:hypothetical protein